jgi:hypothetical protein
VSVIGTVGGESLTLELREGLQTDRLTVPLSELSSAHAQGLARFFP